MNNEKLKLYKELSDSLVGDALVIWVGSMELWAVFSMIPIIMICFMPFVMSSHFDTEINTALMYGVVTFIFYLLMSFTCFWIIAFTKDYKKFKENY